MHASVFDARAFVGLIPSTSGLPPTLSLLPTRSSFRTSSKKLRDHSLRLIIHRQHLGRYLTEPHEFSANPIAILKHFGAI